MFTGKLTISAAMASMAIFNYQKVSFNDICIVDLGDVFQVDRLLQLLILAAGDSGDLFR